MGRSSPHFCDDSNYRKRGQIVNAYVRLGTPSKWSVIGRVCTGCGRFWRQLPGVRD